MAFFAGKVQDLFPGNCSAFLFNLIYSVLQSVYSVVKTVSD